MTLNTVQIGQVANQEVANQKQFAPNEPPPEFHQRAHHVSATCHLRGLAICGDCSCAAREDLSVDFLAQISPITAKALADPVVSVRGLSALTRCTLRTL